MSREPRSAPAPYKREVENAFIMEESSLQHVTPERRIMGKKSLKFPALKTYLLHK